jgi:hypothetical protein
MTAPVTRFRGRKVPVNFDQSCAVPCALISKLSAHFRVLWIANCARRVFPRIQSSSQFSMSKYDVRRLNDHESLSRPSNGLVTFAGTHFHSIQLDVGPVSRRARFYFRWPVFSLLNCPTSRRAERYTVTLMALKRRASSRASILAEHHRRRSRALARLVGFDS